MEINLWASTEETADWLSENTILNNLDFNFKKILESDGNNPTGFHRIPEAIKRILYLDAGDIIIEVNKKPVLVVEISQGAGSGHVPFQRFARIVAAAEYDIPVAYIFPEAKYVTRGKQKAWDRINPTIFRALEKLMRIQNSPALLYYYPSEFDGNRNKKPETLKGLIHDDKFISLPDRKDSEMRDFFDFVDVILNRIIINDTELPLINNQLVSKRRDWMQEEFILKEGTKRIWSPNTKTMKVPTSSLIKYLKQYAGNDYIFGDLLLSRKNTLIYKANAEFRGDPYAGSLSAIDYMNVRIGKNIEDRSMNLVIAWCELDYDEENDELLVVDNKCTIDDFLIEVNKVTDDNKCLLSYDNFKDLSSTTNNIPRYFMQVKHSCIYTKTKEVRVFASFADAILFKDGCLWKDG